MLEKKSLCKFFCQYLGYWIRFLGWVRNRIQSRIRIQGVSRAARIREKGKTCTKTYDNQTAKLVIQGDLAANILCFSVKSCFLAQFSK
jgi:hypothetical protein